MRSYIFSFIGWIATAIGAAWLASSVQTDFGKVEVSNVVYANTFGTKIRAKLFRLKSIDLSGKAPGIVYIHGYQNNRETSDPFCIEMSRRGIVSLCIDAIGRGNSGLPAAADSPQFDKTFGVKASVAYLKSLDFVDPQRVGLMGNSLGGQLAYEAALADPSIRAVVFTGYAFDDRALENAPKNMLMIFGNRDEYRDRMIGTQTREEWMTRDMVKRVTGVARPKENVTYGRFEEGTARRIEFPNGTHITVPHSKAPVASALRWIQKALLPDPALWKDADSQIWQIKEWSCLVAMVCGLFCLLPLLSLLLKLRFFSPLAMPAMTTYTAERREYIVRFVLNGLLMWLYLPLIMILCAVHFYVVRIDRAFPMMMTNSVVFWFFIINLIGFLLFLRWRKKSGRSFESLGLSLGRERRQMPARTGALGALLFLFAYGFEHLIEQLFIVDYRFVFPFASDLTPDRAWIALRYFPFILVGFAATGIFLHVQLKRPERTTRLKTLLDWSFFNTVALVLPLVLFLAVQYIPLIVANVIPLVGPGSSMISFIINLFHVIGVLILCVPISTGCFMYTKTPYLGAFLNAAIVTWMFASAQVIAPLPL